MQSLGLGVKGAAAAGQAGAVTAQGHALVSGATMGLQLLGYQEHKANSYY